jgi:hypothetical protein
MLYWVDVSGSTGRERGKDIDLEGENRAMASSSQY